MELLLNSDEVSEKLGESVLTLYVINFILIVTLKCIVNDFILLVLLLFFLLIYQNNLRTASWLSFMELSIIRA